MRIILKLPAALLVLVLTLITAFLEFLVAFTGCLLSVFALLFFLAAVIAFFSGLVTTGTILLVVAFLVSPFGLPMLAAWLIAGIEAVNDMLKDFITS